MNDDFITILTGRDDKLACRLAETIARESEESSAWYAQLDAFAGLLEHPKSLVRNRALMLIAANARWDGEGRLDALLPEMLALLHDEKPITVRQCVKALAQIARAQPRYAARILSALRSADVSRYRDSMRPLIARDIMQAAEMLNGLAAEQDVPSRCSP